MRLRFGTVRRCTYQRVHLRREAKMHPSYVQRIRDRGRDSLAVAAGSRFGAPHRRRSVRRGGEGASPARITAPMRVGPGCRRSSTEIAPRPWVRSPRSRWIPSGEGGRPRRPAFSLRRLRGRAEPSLPYAVSGIRSPCPASPGLLMPPTPTGAADPCDIACDGRFSRFRDAFVGDVVRFVPLSARFGFTGPRAYPSLLCRRPMTRILSAVTRGRAGLTVGVRSHVPVGSRQGRVGGPVGRLSLSGD